MSQGPWKINEGSFLCQNTYLLHLVLIKDTDTPLISVVQGWGDGLLGLEGRWRNMRF